MKILKDQILLLLKINTPNNFDFYYEHKQIINTNGFVWFCRFGRSNISFDYFGNENTLIFIRDSKKNGGKIYCLLYEDIKNSSPEVAFYPKYYENVKANQAYWLKCTDIFEISIDNFYKTFVTKSSNSDIRNVFNSMCTNFYIKANNDYVL